MTLLSENMTEEEYNKLPGIRSTALKYFIKYGARAYHQKFNLKQFEPDTDKPAFQIGRLFHAWVIEGRKLWAEPWTGYRRGNDYKEYKAECEAENLEVITETDLRKLTLMKQSFESNPLSVSLLEQTVRREQTIQFDYAGLDCKVRLDMWLESDAIVDLKTTRNAAPEKFFYQGVNEFGYHHSAGFYELGVQDYLETDQNIPYLYIAVENQEPYRCAVHKMNEDVREVGRRDVRAALEDIAKCQEENKWPEPLAADVQEYTPGMKWLSDNDALGEVI